MRACLVLLILSLLPRVAAQPARLVLRAVEAETVTHPRSPTPEIGTSDGPAVYEVITTYGPPRDTTGLDVEMHEGQRIYLGATLLDLGLGTVRVADSETDPYTGAQIVTLSLVPSMAEAFERLSAERIGRQVAVLLDGRVLTAPTIHGVISGGYIQIQGSFSRTEAAEIAAFIREATGAATQDAADEEAFDLSSPEAAALSYAHASGRGDWLRTARALHPRALALFSDQTRQSFVIVGGDVRVAPSEDPTPDLDPVPIADVLGEVPGSAWTDFSDTEATALYFAIASGTWTLSGGREMAHIGTLPDGPGAVAVVLRPTDESETYYEGIGMASPIVLRVERVADGWRVLYPTIGQQWQPMRDPGIAHED